MAANTADDNRDMDLFPVRWAYGYWKVVLSLTTVLAQKVFAVLSEIVLLYQACQVLATQEEVLAWFLAFLQSSDRTFHHVHHAVAKSRDNRQMVVCRMTPILSLSAIHMMEN